MVNSWTKWNFKENESDQILIISKKLKIILILFLIIFLILINLKIIEVLSLAEGKIIPQGRIKYVQHLEGGIVEQILTKEGAKVAINEPLVVLSKKKASSEFEEINSRLKSIELSILRVESQKQSRKSIVIPDDKKKYLMMI